MSDLTDNLQITAWVITAGGVIVSWLGALVWKCEENRPAHDNAPRKYPWRAVLLLHALFSTAWLWFPWVGYGVYCLSRSSLNGIDSCERPPKVIPADPKTIDLRKVEKPQ
jgi:hypothetical protein